MEEVQTKVTPIDSQNGKADLPEKEAKKLKRDLEAMEKSAVEYYSFFRMGGALNLSQYRSMGEVEKAAVMVARKRIREEDAKFQMKCMMAVFDNAIKKMTEEGMPGPAPSADAPPPPAEVHIEEVATSKALDEMTTENNQ